MSIEIELPAPELALLRQITKLDDSAAAVVFAARAFLRFSQMRECKAISGKADLDGDWQKLEDLELAEPDFPR